MKGKKPSAPQSVQHRISKTTLSAPSDVSPKFSFLFTNSKNWPERSRR